MNLIDYVQGFATGVIVYVTLEGMINRVIRKRKENKKMASALTPMNDANVQPAGRAEENLAPKQLQERELTWKEIKEKNKLLKEDIVDYVVYLNDGLTIEISAHSCDCYSNREIYIFSLMRDIRGRSITVGVIPTNLVKFVSIKGTKYVEKEENRRIKA